MLSIERINRQLHCATELDNFSQQPTLQEYSSIPVNSQVPLQKGQLRRRVPGSVVDNSNKCMRALVVAIANYLNITVVSNQRSLAEREV